MIAKYWADFALTKTICSMSPDVLDLPEYLSILSRVYKEYQKILDTFRKFLNGCPPEFCSNSRCLSDGEAQGNIYFNLILFNFGVYCIFIQGLSS